MTNLYLTTVAADAGVTAGSGTKWKAGWSAGASSRSVVKKCQNPRVTPDQMTDGVSTTDGTVVAWYTEQLDPVTITGTITCSMWDREVDTSTNARPAILIERCSADGTVLATVMDSIDAGAGEMATTAGGAADTVTLTAANVADTAISGGERLRISLWMASTALSTTTTRYAQYYVNGPTGSAGSSQLAFTESLAVYAPPEVSPYLEVYGFPVSGVGAPDTIEWVQVSVTEHQSDALQAACTFELWDYSGTPAQIGSTQTGTASTSTGNVSAATFTGVTYSQLAALRVRVYGNANTGSGHIESVDAVSLTVAYMPSSAAGATVSPAVVTSTSARPAVTVATGATATPAVVTVATARPAVTVVTAGNATATPAVVTVATARPAPVVRQDAGAAPAVLAVATAQPAVTVTSGGGATVTPAAVPAPATVPAATVYAYPETSPALELSGFTFTGVGSSDTVEWVQVSVTEYQSAASMAACTFELWDDTATQIGTTQTGTASTSTGNVSTATFAGVTYAQLATLRVRVYGHSGTAPPGSVESVDSVSLTVAYMPSGAGDATAGAVLAAATSAVPAPVVRQDASPAPGCGDRGHVAACGGRLRGRRRHRQRRHGSRRSRSSCGHSPERRHHAPRGRNGPSGGDVQRRRVQRLDNPDRRRCDRRNVGCARGDGHRDSWHVSRTCPCDGGGSGPRSDGHRRQQRHSQPRRRRRNVGCARGDGHRDSDREPRRCSCGVYPARGDGHRWYGDSCHTGCHSGHVGCPGAGGPAGREAITGRRGRRHGTASPGSDRRRVRVRRGVRGCRRNRPARAGGAAGRQPRAWRCRISHSAACGDCHHDQQRHGSGRRRHCRVGPPRGHRYGRCRDGRQPGRCVRTSRCPCAGGPAGRESRTCRTARGNGHCQPRE